MNAQAISIGMPKSTSMFRALLWKEWRQQRMVVLLIATLPALLFCVTFPFLDEMLRAGASIVAGIALAIVPAVLGSGAFCNEEDDGSAEFLRRLPAGNVRLFITKMTPVVAGTAVSFFLLYAAARLICSNIEHVESRNVLESLGQLQGPGGVVVALGLLSLGTLPALTSTWARRTMPCILVSLLVIAALSGLLWVTSSFYIGYYSSWKGLHRSYPHGMDALSGLRWLVWWPAGIVFVIIGVASPLFWAWSRAGMSLGATFRRSIALLILLPVACMVPVSGRFAYYTYMAGPETFYRNGWVSPDAYSIRDAANNQWLPVRCICPEWKSSDRTGFLNVETGAWRWAMKGRSSWVAGDGVSPSGDRFVVHSQESFRLFRRPDYQRRDNYVVTLPAGTAESVSTLCPEMPATGFREAAGWSDDHTIVFHTQKSFLFADLTTGTVRECLNPPSVDDWLRTRAVTSHGTYAMESSRSRENEALVRFAPDLKVAQVFDLPEDSSGGVRLIAMAKNSPKALWQVADPIEHKRHYALMTLNGGEATFTTLPSEVRWFDIGFVWDDERLLFNSETAMALYDPADGTRHPILIDELLAGSFRITYTDLSPSRRCALLLLTRTGDRREKERKYAVVDLETGRSAIVGSDFRQMSWVNDDTLLAFEDDARNVFSLVNSDGSGKRPLFND
jgi:hypothetical protein